MKKSANGRISLTENEADEIRECLESLFAMSGTLDEDFNTECNRAGRYARKLYKLIYGEGTPRWEPVDRIESKLSSYETGRIL